MSVCVCVFDLCVSLCVSFSCVWFSLNDLCLSLCVSLCVSMICVWFSLMICVCLCGFLLFWKPPSVAGFRGAYTPLPSEGGFIIKYNHFFFLAHVCYFCVSVCVSLICAWFSVDELCVSLRVSYMCVCFSLMMCVCVAVHDPVLSAGRHAPIFFLIVRVCQGFDLCVALSNDLCEDLSHSLCVSLCVAVYDSVLSTSSACRHTHSKKTKKIG